MKLEGRDLHEGLQGDDVALLHRELKQLGFNIATEETKKQFFGPGTEKAVLEFQRQHDLDDTGVVDVHTANELNAAVSAPPQRERFIVRGQIRKPDNSPIPSVAVLAFDKDLRTEQPLGETSSDERGNYEIAYSANRFRRAEKKSADLVVRVFDPEGKGLAESEILFNAPPDATINVIVAPRQQERLSEYEQLVAELNPLLEDVELADLTQKDIKFLAAEAADKAERIKLISTAAQLTSKTKLTAEAFYGWFRHNLPTDLDRLVEIEANVLRKALEEAIKEKIIPTTLLESLDVILFQMAELNVARKVREEATYTPHQVFGRLLEQTSGAPLSQFGVNGFDLDAGDQPRDLGQSITDAEGLFEFVYTTPPDALTAKARRRLNLLILDREGSEIYQIEITVAADELKVVDVRVPLPPVHETPAPTLAELGAAISPPLPQKLIDALAQKGVHTLADVLKTGGLDSLDGMPVASDDPSLRNLEAHARLSTLSSDLQLNDTLIKSGFNSPSGVARSRRTGFVRAARERVGDYKAFEMQARAKAQQHVFTNAATHLQTEKANGSDGLGFVAMPSLGGMLDQVCSCEDCEAAVSPLAYLADLIAYATEHLEDGNDPVTLSFLKSTFHQRFGDLPAACEEMNRQVRQVRICIEVLRSYLKAKNLPAKIPHKKALADAEKAYYLEAYMTLLIKVGTSYEEIRQARNADPARRRALAERLGIDLGHTRPDHLDALFVEPLKLNEGVLETLFGLVDTTRDVLSEGAKLGDTNSQVTAWNLNEVEWNRSTDREGSVYVKLNKPAANVFRIKLFRDKARSELVASGERGSPQGTVAVEEQNNSGLSGKLSITFVANTDQIELIGVPRLLSWRLEHLRTLWFAQDFPDDAYHAGQSLTHLKQLPQGFQIPLNLLKRLQYFADEQLLVFNGVMSNQTYELLLGMSPDKNYRRAVHHLFEQSQRPPIIDPDLVGPDDFRAPFAGANQADPLKAFDLWLKRREWVDQNLNELRQSREEDGLAPVLETIFGDALPDFDTLLVNSTSGSDTEKERAHDTLNGLDLTVESLSRLIAIRDKDQLAASDETNEPVKPEEWEEVYSILVQTKKVKQFPAWRAEEQSNLILLSAEEFRRPLREAVEGLWPPSRPLPTNSKPLIDPDEIKLGELPEPMAGRLAIAIWQERLLRLDSIKQNLKDRLKKAKLDQDIDPMMTLMRHALGDPNQGGPLPLPDAAQPDDAELESLNTHLSSSDPAEVDAAAATIEQKLHMPVDEFKRLMAVKLKLDDLQTEPTSDEWADVLAILAKARKVKREYPAWLLEEETAELNEKYWLVRKAALPRWRSSAEARSAWLQALRTRSSAPIIDPNLINPGDIRDPAPGDAALAFWKERRDWVKAALAALKSKRQSHLVRLTGFDSILISPTSLPGGEQLGSLAGSSALQGLSDELKTAREFNGLKYILTQIWGSPLPNFNRLKADLASDSDSIRINARTEITGKLYLTIQDFERLIDVRQKVADAEDVTPVEWESVYKLLAEAALLKSIIGLADARTNGEDIESRLEQLNLPPDAFARLVQIRNILINDAPVLDDEWEEVYAILTQVQKRRRFGAWRSEERGKKLLLGPDDFKIPPPLPLRFPPLEPAPLSPWLATLIERQDWQDALQARIDQQQTVHDALREAVGSAEEVALPKLRDALVWASNDVSFMVAERAKWIGDRLLIDAQNSGCAMTTRVSQAIETVQGLLFSVRTRIHEDTYPNLDLDSDDFEESWEWIGSYATWRTAMFVFLYPENILIPSLRTRQTPAFRTLISSLRSNRRLNPKQAREVASNYAEYFHDIATLKLEASCQTRTRVINSDGEAAGYSYLMHMFARSSATKTVYWSHHNPEDDSGYGQSFWEAVPGLDNVLELIGAVPFQIAEGERFIYLFARAREKGTQKLVFLKYDLEHLIWDTEASELELPEEATEFTGIAMQHSREGRPPRLAIRLPKGAIYSRRLNADGTDWKDSAEWIPIVGNLHGARFSKLCGMVEFSDVAFCLIVSSSNDYISYLLSGDWNDGYWRFVANGEYRGAIYWPETSEIFVFWSEGSQVKHRAIKPSTRVQITMPNLLLYEVWLKDVVGVSLGGIAVPDGLPFAGLTFFEFLYHDGVELIKAYFTHLYEKSLSAFDGAAANSMALLESISAINWANNMPYVLKLFRYLAIYWLAGKVANTDSYQDKDFGDWKLAARATKIFFGFSDEFAPSDALATVLKLSARMEDPFAMYYWRIGIELSSPFAAMQGLQRIVPTSGAISDETPRQFSVQFDTPYRTRFSRHQPGRLFEPVLARRRVAPRVTGPFTISEGQSEDKLQSRRAKIKNVFLDNQLGPRSNLVYLEEAFYFVPVHLALQLQSRGQYASALDWFRSVYDYSRPLTLRKIYYGLSKEESLAAVYERAEDWLLDPLNPHEIAATRRNTYTRFTLLSIVRCLLEFADAEFTRDTAESVPRARLLYLTALELLNTPELQQRLDACANIIGSLEIDLGDADWVSAWAGFNRELSTISNVKRLTQLVGEINAIHNNGASAEDRFIAARALLAGERAATRSPGTLADAIERKASSTAKLHAALSAQPEIAAAATRAADLAASSLRNAVSLVTGIRTDALDKADLPWLSRKMSTGSADGAGPTTQREADGTSMRTDYSVLTRSNPRARTHVDSLATFAKTSPMTAVKIVSGVSTGAFVPSPHYEFCIPPNPILKALRLRAELNLYKIRTCRNIAGMERQLEPYAAPTDTFSGMPMIGAGGQLVLPGLAVLKPTPYRYPVLIERAKQLVGLAQQIEAAFLSTLEKGDAERYSLLKARQDMNLAKAGVRLQTLRVKQAEDGVNLAELQQERAQIQVNQYQEWLDQGISDLESAAIGLLISSMALPESVSGGTGLSVSYSPAGIVKTLASIFATYASYERREDEWKFQKALAEQDVRIGTQQVKIAEDQVRVVEQERMISEMQADQAKEVLDFLSTKFTNIELYDWMSGILEGVYSFFLQEATAMAQVATSQLAFERQEVPPPYIQADYWEIPAEGFSGSDGKAPDRRGLTGSARLLQDIHQLDQYAFTTNQRKLQLTKTISLAQMAPAEFQRFRETGVMRFTTTMEMFDRDFPGHYLRLLRRVRTSTIALIPPVQGIRATLSTTGTSRVVIGGDIFQTIIVNHGPQSIALSSPRDATGLFELEQQSEMLLPFEGLGVATSWEFRMPKAANLFDYRTIADVLVTIEYTALNSFDYYQQVIQTLRPTLSADRPFSFRHQFADQWYDFHNPDQTATPMIVRFSTRREDFPPNLERIKIGQVALYFARAGGKTFEVPVSHLRYTEQDNGGSVGGGSISIDGLISTLKGNAGSWTSMIGKSPIGEWELALPNTHEIRNRFKDQEIEDILFVITYAGRTPEWPT